MAIGYSPLSVPFRLTPEDMGVADYGSAYTKGVENAYTPKNLAEKLLAAQLSNKHQSIVNQFLPRSEEARIGGLEASRSAREIGNQGLAERLNEQLQGSQLMNKLRQQKLSEAENEHRLNESIFGDGNNPDLRQNMISGIRNKDNESLGMNENVVNAGNPNFYHLDELYNSNPLARKLLESKGFKQSQVTKVDPKTGITSVITTNPSGKVTVSQSGVASNNGFSPLTNKTRSTLQAQKQAIPQLKEVIEKLKNTPSPVELPLPYGVGKAYRASSRAEHDALVNLGKDTFVKAKGLNVTDKSLETGAHILDRKPYETDSSYHKRLDNLSESLNEDEKSVNKSLKKGISTNEAEPYETRPGEAEGESIPMYKNGVLHFIPVKEEKEAVKLGYKYE